MRLSPEHVVRIAGVRDSETESPADQRMEPRLSSRGTALVSQLHGDHAAPEFSARIYDISSGGVGLYLHQPVRKGDRLCVTLPVSDGRHPVRIICSVRYVRMTGERLYRVGADFVCVAIEELPAHPGSYATATAD